MRLLRSPVWLVLVYVTAVSTGAQSKPNFSGIWKLLNGDHPSSSLIIEQRETDLVVVEFIEDRPGMVKGPIDGQPHPQTVDGSPCDFLARWEGDTLFYEIKCGTPDSASRVTEVHHRMRLAANGKTMSVKRTNVVPQPGIVNQKWERQDPLSRDALLTGFDARLKLDDPAAGNGPEGNRLRGLIGYAFNDVAQAESEYLPIINQKPPSRFRAEARANLAEVYRRNGMVRKALLYCNFADSFLYRKLAKYPEMAVVHREYARVQTARDKDGHLMLPVVAAGKDATYLVDTGSNNSLMRISEARRLGLKLEPPRLAIVNGIVRFQSFLTIVPVLTVGATHVENAPLWVVPDERLDWPGVIGIDILLKLETLRWTANGAAEIGFPAEEKDIHKANLCFWHNEVFADASTKGQGGIVLFLDTGNYAMKLYPRFVAGFPDLVATNSKKSQFDWNGLGGHRELQELILPELSLTFGGADLAFHPGSALLDKPPVNSEFHGAIGMDVLNLAQRVTLDLKAMRLTIE